MQLPRLFRTSVFRLTLAYMALFALSVGALSAFIYWATLGYLETQTNAIIEAEITGLYEQYERSGVGGLRDVDWGVAIARKAGAAAPQVLNTRSLAEVESYFEARRRRARELLGSSSR